ncbi:MAG TPA: M20/M25/M40 family metallo-hydrolase [Bacteroidales bacterium]|nr:M20/M25/M40 family metallo-hydrolase [Bacteroidales bacterium]HQB56171.1 M20/M25/M40 family metallo-hydrolase [Bacteroidales bacterium]
MRLSFLITGTVVLATTVLFLNCRKPLSRPDMRSMEEIVYTLSSADFKGREAGSSQDSAIAAYIAGKIAAFGFEPYFNEGPLHRFRYRNVSSWNVVMVYRGKETNGTVLIGAHYDHLGTGGHGSGSLRPDTLALHPGADDNASGVAAAIETVRLLKELGKRKGLKKDIIFAAFGAEEKGTIGSSILADTLEKMGSLPSLMINMDMVGRLRDSILQVGGTGTFQGADSLLRSHLTSSLPLVLKTSESGYGPSDHSVFYRSKVPVLFFSTGPHTDYHTPFDTPERINYPGMVPIVSYVTSLSAAVAVYGFEPQYRETYQNEPLPEQIRFQVSLGVIPDLTYEGEGFCAGTIIMGRPSHKAGMQDGDVVIQINDRPITNIETYMETLGQLEEGQLIHITVRRDGQLLHLEVQL